ncbi:hypothetical protein [Microbacterium sorbitolivorans]|uniref:hypothetical protein n=1 Tax=Microbacterium sorbitolivorans TaxID=1867410 RepID=UPI001E29D078|nr:hypothetical protein [Microbacterium sorbitolivorans]
MASATCGRHTATATSSGVANTFAQLHGLRRDDDLRYAVELATSRAAGFVGADAHDIVAGARADVVLLDAQNAQDALMRSPHAP